MESLAVGEPGEGGWTGSPLGSRCSCYQTILDTQQSQSTDAHVEKRESSAYAWAQFEKQEDGRSCSKTQDSLMAFRNGF